MKTCSTCRYEAPWIAVTILYGLFLLGALFSGSFTFFLALVLLAIVAYNANRYLAKFRERNCADYDCCCACHFAITCACKCHYWCGSGPIAEAKEVPQPCCECDWRHGNDRFNVTPYDFDTYRCRCRCHKMRTVVTNCGCGCHRWCSWKFRKQ
ncbi:MAG: hypothetical protein UY12_C0034G0010 [Parcubacteria group bacterium GW2011_GWA2_47_8b]|nr:MAG: hypothetical protein UY12_C0034G0010 [Parcubacteria group bacterium GW2011_GWA2_47_8b]